MSRKMIQIVVDGDVFDVHERLKQQPHVKAHVVTIDSLRIYYYNNKISEKDLLSIIQSCGKRRPNKVLHITRKTISNE